MVLVEGPWDKVHRVIGQAHTVLHQQGVVRIQSDIRSGSRYVSLLFWFWWMKEGYGADFFDRIDKVQSFEDKVAAVNKLLGKK